MNANPQIITQFVNFNENLSIPFFQRAYVWQQEQWERLITDMKFVTRTRKPYFMGSVILKDVKDPNGQIIGRTIIDGQQRLTTLAIFYKVFSLITNQTMWFDQIFRQSDDTLVIDHNYNTKKDFEKILNLTTLEDIPNEHGSSNVIKAYNYFRQEIAEALSDVSNPTLDLKAIRNLLTFVVITLDANEDEQQIFDTINSLGVTLTTGELLKNYFYNKSSLSLYETTWKPVFENDAECLSYWNKEYSTGRARRNNLEVFFYSFLQIKLQDPQLRVSADDKAYLGRYENLFNNYKNFISKYNVDRLNLVSEILEYAKIYRANLDFNKIDKDNGDDTPSGYGIERINTIIYGMEANTIIPYILYVLKNVASIDERNAIFRIVESYLMRRYICQASNKNYNRLFSENLIGNNILSANSLDIFFSSFKGGQQSTMALPTDDEIIEAFKTNRLYNKQTTCILYLLESASRDATRMGTNLKPLEGYTLEHLMPKKWRNNWTFPTSNTEEERDRLLLTLGNLAIIPQPLNSSIRDSNWTTKLNGKNTKTGLLVNAAGLITMQNVLNKADWNEVTICERAEELAELALRIW
jgi:hypothetical protein